MNQDNQQGRRSEQPVQGGQPTQRSRSQGGRPTQGSQSQGGRPTQGSQSQGGRPTQGSQSQGGQKIEHGRPQVEATQPPGGEQGSAVTTSVAEMTLDSPTLRWVSIEHPESAVELGPEDHVLESVFNPGMDAWEVLVLVQPRDDEDGGEDED